MNLLLDENLRRDVSVHLKTGVHDPPDSGNGARQEFYIVCHEEIYPGGGSAGEVQGVQRLDSVEGPKLCIGLRASERVGQEVQVGLGKEAAVGSDGEGVMFAGGEHEEFIEDEEASGDAMFAGAQALHEPLRCLA